jgi:hypothetical protein
MSKLILRDGNLLLSDGGGTLRYYDGEGEPPDNCCCEEAPETGVCDDCCDSGTPPFANYVVDFGAGGWTSIVCGRCEEVAGEWTVTQQGTACSWVITSVVDAGGGVECSIVVSVDLVPDTGGCRWFAQVTITRASGGSQTHGRFALFRSDLIDSDECQTMPVTLTKISEGVVPTRLNICNGTLPATITLEAP